MNADTRKKIVMTALELFYVKGYQSTSISDILSRSQVHSGSLYHFFPGKQDVLVAVLEFYRDGIRENLLDFAWVDVTDPIEKIFALLNGYRTGLLMSDYAHGCPIGNLALEISEPDPRVRDLIATNFSNCVGHRILPGRREGPSARRPRQARARRIRSHHHGRRHHAGPHPPRHRPVRPQRFSTA